MSASTQPAPPARGVSASRRARSSRRPAAIGLALLGAAGLLAAGRPGPPPVPPTRAPPELTASWTPSAGVWPGMARPAAGTAVDTTALRRHTAVLAAPGLLGRAAGSAGARRAADYIAAELSRAGVPPVGGAYLQPVPLRRVRYGPGAALALVTGADTLRLERGRDFVPGSVGRGGPRPFAGEVVLLGAPEGALRVRPADLRGRVVATLGPLGTASLALLPAWAAAGVAGVVELLPDSAAFAGYAAARGDLRYFLGARVAEPVWQPPLPVLVAGPGMAGALLDAWESAADGDGPPLPSLRYRPGFRVDTLETANVAGLVRGSDPRRHHEVVVVTAHYDHLGVGPADAAGDSVYDGFSDNAAGVAMALEVGRLLQEDPPARSVLLLFPTAEEVGLLGAAFHAEHPAVPRDRLVAVVNLDGGAPPAPPREWRLAAGSLSSLGTLAADVVRSHGWQPTLDEGSPNSDHWPFLVRGVPSLFLIPGGAWEGLDAGAAARLRLRWDRYHTPADEYDPAFPFAGLARYADLAHAIVRRVADAPTAPRLQIAPAR